MCGVGDDYRGFDLSKGPIERTPPTILNVIGLVTQKLAPAVYPSVVFTVKPINNIMELERELVLFL